MPLAALVSVEACLSSDSDPDGEYIQEAPIVVVELISPADRLHRMLERIDDYLAFGVSAA